MLPPNSLSRLVTLVLLANTDATLSLLVATFRAVTSRYCPFRFHIESTRRLILLILIDFAAISMLIVYFACHYADFRRISLISFDRFTPPTMISMARRPITLVKPIC